MKAKDLTKFTVVLPAALLAADAAMAQRPLGIDVNSYQGSINWTSVYASGVRFAFAKATEGNYYQDSYFKSNMTNGKNAGVQMGAYHFARPDINCASTEATYFWNFAGGYIKSDGKSIYPLVDFETANGVSCVANYTTWFNNWASDVKAKDATFLHPVIFVDACSTACELSTNITLSAFVGSLGNGTGPTPWTSCQCCNAWDPCGTSGWTYWGYGTGSIAGISGPVDLDTFNGTLATLKSTQGVGGN